MKYEFDLEENGGKEVKYKIITKIWQLSSDVRNMVVRSGYGGCGYKGSKVSQLWNWKRSGDTRDSISIRAGLVTCTFENILEFLGR